MEYALKQQAVAKQLKIASVRGSGRAILIGPDERESGEVVVRNMDTGTEEQVPITALTEDLAWLGGRETP